MNLYRQSIALFGFALPAFICLVVIGGAVLTKSKIATSFNSKQNEFKGFKQNKIQALALEAEIANKRDHFAQWETLLAKETASSVTSNIRQIEDKLPSKEFQLTEQESPSGRAGFAAATAQNAAQVRLGFRATYRSMQRALLELETRMPQLQLQELRMDPSSSSNSLNFGITYTAWEQ
jgi:hypothetical protein